MTGKIRKKRSKLRVSQAAQKRIVRKPVPGFPGYSASRDGRVWSQWRPAGPILGWTIGKDYRELKQVPSKNGYWLVCLHPRGMKQRYVSAARVVLTAFTGDAPIGCECCHNNGNRTDNRLRNLRWDTRKNNHADKLKHGTHQRGDRNGNAKLDENQVRQMIAEYRRGGQTQANVAAKFGVSGSLISKIITRKKNWRWLGL